MTQLWEQRIYLFFLVLVFVLTPLYLMVLILKRTTPY